MPASRDEGRKPRQIETLLAAADRLFGHVLSGGPAGIGVLDTELRTLLEQKEGGAKPPAGCSEEEFALASGLVSTPKSLIETYHALISDQLDLLEPLAV